MSEQLKTIKFLEGKGYTVTHNSAWPIMTNTETGKRVQIDFNGGQHCRGWVGTMSTKHKLAMVDYYVLGASAKSILEDEEAFEHVASDEVESVLEEFAEILRQHYVS